jgi:hypothetical protein
MMHPWWPKSVKKKNVVHAPHVVSVQQVLLLAPPCVAQVRMPLPPMAATNLPKPRAPKPNPPLSAFVKTHPHLQLRTAKENKHVATSSSQVP